MLSREGKVAKMWKVSILRGERTEGCRNRVRVVDAELKDEEPEGDAGGVDKVSRGKGREKNSELPEDTC